MKKQISLDQLKPGMFLVGMDQSWWNTPFLFHHRFIKDKSEIHRLRQAGVRHVIIDTAKGLSEEDFPLSETDSVVSPPSENPPHQDHAGGVSLPPVDSSSMQEEEHRTSDSTGDLHMDVKATTPAGDSPPLTTQEVAQRVRDAAIQAVQQVFEGVRIGLPLDNPILEKAANAIVQQVLHDSQALPQLVLIHNLSMVDKHLYSHVVDVCALSVVLGIEMGWDEATLRLLAVGALLHDIGYVRLPNNLVRNRRQATESEHDLLVKHAEIGYSMIQTCPDFSDEVKRIVLEHHERMDGSGEPNAIKGEQVLPLGQVVALVDEFDKVTSNWGKGPSRSSAIVLRELYQEAQEGRFLMRPIERLIQCLGIYPFGSVVELSTGEQGIVILTNPSNLLKPKVKVIAGSDHGPYPVPFIVDLANPSPGEPVRSIRSLLDAHQEQIHVEKYLTVEG